MRISPALSFMDMLWHVPTKLSLSFIDMLWHVPTKLSVSFIDMLWHVPTKLSLSFIDMLWHVPTKLSLSFMDMLWHVRTKLSLSFIDMLWHVPTTLSLFLFACHDPEYNIHYSTDPSRAALKDSTLQGYQVKKFKENSWQYFLQQLPVVDSPVLDYTGKKVRHQFKSAGVIPYDVGKADLQQCADALMRLRSEYLFKQNQHDRIGFHFVSGQFYSFNDYCAGKRPVPSGNSVRFITGSPAEKNHASLRKYLDLVYTYASTISLAKELKNTNEFEVGTVVIYAGSPGHCFIIIDEMENAEGKKLFKLAEGYTPAQSIYVIRNSDGTAWHELSEGEIETASYVFSSYELKKFE